MTGEQREGVPELALTLAKAKGRDGATRWSWIGTTAGGSMARGSLVEAKSVELVIAKNDNESLALQD